MSKLEIDQIIHHFSHQHPLSLFNTQKHVLNTPPTCSGCTLKASGWIYSCNTCNYSLHISCAKMPPKISHPVDASHPLILFPSPVYPEGVFKCNACGKQGTGFCYHCKECQLDFHILCAERPLSITHEAHHHSLRLEFSPPYYNKSFNCDICRRPGSNHWLYRCSTCEFDAHISCTSNKFGVASKVNSQQHVNQMNHYPQQQLLQQQVIQQQLLQQQQQIDLPCMPPQISVPVNGYGIGSQGTHYLNRSISAPSIGVTHHVQPGGRTGIVSDLMQNAMEGFMQGVSQQVGQNLMQGLSGGDPSSSGLGIGSLVLNTFMGLN